MIDSPILMGSDQDYYLNDPLPMDFNRDGYLIASEPMGMV